MGIAAIVIGTLGVISALLPTFGISQLVGIVLGIIALVLGVIARKQSRELGLATGGPTAGIILGVMATLISVLLYASCVYWAKRVGDSVGRVGEDFKKQLNNKAFKKAMEQAHQEQKKALQSK